MMGMMCRGEVWKGKLRWTETVAAAVVAVVIARMMMVMMGEMKILIPLGEVEQCLTPETILDFQFLLQTEDPLLIQTLLTTEGRNHLRLLLVHSFQTRCELQEFLILIHQGSTHVLQCRDLAPELEIRTALMPLLLPQEIQASSTNPHRIMVILPEDRNP